MAKQIFGLTKKDKKAVQGGITRAKNNPLGGAGQKRERRQQPDIIDDGDYFRISNTSGDHESGQWVSIDDGFDPDSSICGVAPVNQFLADVDAVELELTTTTGTVFIYIESELVGDPATSATATIEQSTSYPEWEDDKGKQVKYRISFTSNIINVIAPVKMIFPVVIGDCDE